MLTEFASTTGAQRVLFRKVKLLAISLFPMTLGLVLLAALSSEDETLPNASCVTITADIERVLATIRALESGGDYTIRAHGSTASGAYQFLDSSWDGYGGYPHASDAPPEVQDAKAATNVAAILDRNGGDVASVPVVWYIGHVPAADSAEWDRVPAPEAGNRLTPRQYQTRWMNEYGRRAPSTPTSLEAPTSTLEPIAPAPGSCIGGGVEPMPGGWSLPGPRELIEENPSALDAPHHDYPAWDWIIPVNTPIYAVHGGTVVNIQSWPHNWWTSGCGTAGGGECSTCGVGVTIRDVEGVHWTYCHGSNVTVALNHEVESGRQIMWSGNTGRSGAPHLHLEIRVDGIRRCPQPLMRALFERRDPAPLAAVPQFQCTF